jgi:hypothetical protein
MVAAEQTIESKRPQRLKDSDWKVLLKNISNGRCTPFIGPEACSGLYPSKGDRAERWADDEEYPYPLHDRRELARVAQFLAISDYEARPIDQLVEEFKDVKSPDYTNPTELHRVLADLPLPVYITTNYDDFMFRAFGKRTIAKDGRQDFCRWRKGPVAERGALGGEYQPTVANPVVFHLYGHIDERTSLVLTENDYLKFLVRVSREQKLIPPVIQGAISGGSLLFLGYRLDEWDFRILFHTLQPFLESSLGEGGHVSVQILPKDNPTSDAQKEKVTNYLDLYFQKLNTRVYWGSCHEFVEELRERWEASKYAK